MRKRSLLSNMLVNKQLRVGKYNSISALSHSFLLRSFLLHLVLVQTKPVAGSLSGGLAGDHATERARSVTVPKLGVACPGNCSCVSVYTSVDGASLGQECGHLSRVDGVGDTGSERHRLLSPIALASVEAGGNRAAC